MIDTPLPEASLDISSLPSSPNVYNKNIYNEDDNITDVTTAEFSESEFSYAPLYSDSFAYSHLLAPEPSSDLIVSPEQPLQLKHVRFNPTISTAKILPQPVNLNATTDACSKTEQCISSTATVESKNQAIEKSISVPSDNHLLSCPVLHSTLQLQRQLTELENPSDNLSACLPNISTVPEIALQALNIDGRRRIFRDLVNVSPDMEEIVIRAERQMQSLSRSLKSEKSDSASSAEVNATVKHLDEPDPLEFYNAEYMVVQWLDTSLPGLPDLNPHMYEPDPFLLGNVYQQILHSHTS